MSSSFRSLFTKISLLLIIISISTFPLPLAAQITSMKAITFKDLLPDREQLPRFDVRALRRPRTTKSDVEQKKRTLALKTATPDNIVLRWDHQMDLPHNLHAYGMPLSPASNADLVTIARRFALENRAVLEASPFQFQNARVSALTTDRRAGLTRLVLEQRVGGIRVFDSEMMFVIDSRGRVLSQSGHFAPEPAFRTLTAAPALTSEQALRRASEFCEINLTSPIATLPDRISSRDRVIISSDELYPHTEVSLVYYPITQDEARLAYQVLLYSRAKITDSYLVLIDAETGQMLRRESLTRSMQASQGRVFTKESPLLGERELVPLAGDATASPEGWITSNRTEGNNTRVSFNPLLQGGKPTKASGGSFDFPLDFSVTPVRSSKASATNLFYWINQSHDQFYALGFTEEWRNFQLNNFGRGGLGNDRVNAETLRGAKLNPSSAGQLVRNNAFFSPTLEGQSPLVAMLLWEFNSEGGPVRLDSSYDAGVIIHEYTHGVSIRLTGTDNTLGLRNLQGAGMGEGWSDFFAASFLDSGDRPLDASTVVGAYVTASPEGVRSFPYTTRMDINPLTFGNIASNAAVHFQGTVWCSMLWDLRQSLIARHGFDEGRRRAEQMVVDALKITPTSPLFTDARDAIIIVGQNSNQAEDLDLVWRSFARRGLGLFATTSSEFPTTGAAITLEESFDLPAQFTAGLFFISDRAAALTVVGESLPLVLIDRDLIGLTEATVRARNLRTGDEVAVPLALAAEAGRFAGTFSTVAPGQGGQQSLAATPGDVISITYTNERDESGQPEILEARTTAARRAVFYEDNFDGSLEWEKGIAIGDGDEVTNFWSLTSHHAVSLPNSISFGRERKGQFFAPRSSAGIIVSPIIEGEGFSRLQLEFDYLFNGYTGDLFELPDQVTAIVQGSTISAQFTITPSDETRSFQSISIPLNSPEESSLILVAFFFFSSDASIDRRNFDGIFIDNVRLIGVTAQ